jgi:amino acid transporter
MANESHEADENAGRKLRKVLGLRDLIPMQILIVIGPSWTGTAAHQGGTHVSFWLAGTVLLFLPVAAVVQYCVQIWPYEGGVYQWTKHAFGPFAGFLSAWNLGAWVLLVLATLGVQTASGVSYALGPRAAWIAEDHLIISGLNICLFAGILLICIPGMRFGRWISHSGTAATLLVVGLLIMLLFVHPHASSLRTYVPPQTAFSARLPILTLVSLNLFSKIAFNGFTALEQVAVFAGETRDAARSILRSAWIAAPTIAFMYILMTGSILTYTLADRVDLVNPIAQVIAAAFGSSGATGGIDWGAVLGRAAILALTLALIAQAAVYIAETSRLPMVAAWDHLLPAWFTRLHPRYRTPTRSLAVIVFAAVLFAFLASSGAGGAGEAFQLLVTSAFVCYGVNYLLMFAVPLLVGTRFSMRPDLKPSLFLRAACVCGASVTLLSMIFNLVPIVEVARPWIFALKVAGTVVGINLIATAIYWRGSRANHAET